MGTISLAFLAVGLFIMLVNVVQFICFKENIIIEVDCKKNHMNLILQIYLGLLMFFLLAYGMLLCMFCTINLDKGKLLISQILFWGSIFVLINQIILQKLYQDIMKVKLAETDSLTGLLNSGAGQKNVEQVLGKNQEAVAVFMIDLDHFKQINDIYGHLAGDDVIRRVAEVIRKSISSEDIVSRFGGDEFMLCMKNPSREQVKEVAENIIFQVMEIGKKYAKANLTSSIGIAYTVCDSYKKFSYKEMIERADSALYSVKKLGKNSYEFAVL